MRTPTVIWDEIVRLGEPRKDGKRGAENTQGNGRDVTDVTELLSHLPSMEYTNTYITILFYEWWESFVNFSELIKYMNFIFFSFQIKQLNL